MKKKPANKTCRKKRKSDGQLKRGVQRAIADYNCLKHVLPTARNLRPCNSGSVVQKPLWYSNYKFKFPKNFKKHARSIKRTIANECVSETQNVNRSSINDRIANNIKSLGSENFNTGWNFLGNNQFTYHLTQNFLKNRTIKMANSTSKSHPPLANITITFEQMMNIRKKRLNKKYQRSLSESLEVESKAELNESVVEIVDQTGVCNDENQCCIVEEDQDIVEVRNDTGLLLGCDSKNNDIPINNKFEFAIEGRTEKNDRDVEIKQVDGRGSACASDNNLKDIDCGGCSEVGKSTEANQDVIHLDSFNVDDSVINLSPVIDLDSLNVDDSVIHLSPLETSSILKMEEAPKQTSFDDLNNQSVIIITSNSKDLPKAPSSDTKIKRTRSSSVITIPDTPELFQDVSDNDIIFVSEERRSATALHVKRRKLDRKPSVTIVDDDDIKPLEARRSVYCTKGKIAKKSKRKRKLRIVTQITTATSTITSELASCADVNCINKTNNNRTLMQQTVQPCTCQANKSVSSVTPNILTIPEESATAAHSSHENRTLQLKPINNYCLPCNRSANNTFGSNIYNAGHVIKKGLRQIIIDGSNVALGHSNGVLFSVKGLQIAIDYFVKKGHKVTAFVPQYRLKLGQCSNPDLLRRLGDKRLVVFTPSREVKGRRITPYDDRFIIQYATTCEGVVVSNDHFRDLLREKPEWRHTIERRLLMYTWIDDVLIFPEDPLGRHGPNLSQFLRFP